MGYNRAFSSLACPRLIWGYQIKGESGFLYLPLLAIQRLKRGRGVQVVSPNSPTVV